MVYTYCRRKNVEKEDKKHCYNFIYLLGSSSANVWKKEKAVAFVNTGIVLGLAFLSSNKQHFTNVKQRNCILQCLKWKYLLSQIKLPSWMGWWWGCFYIGLKGVLEISQMENTWDLNFLFSEQQIFPSTVNSLPGLRICSQR